MPDQAQILLDHFNVLDKLWGEISTGFVNRWRISLSTPIVKNARFRQRYSIDLQYRYMVQYRSNVAESGHFLQRGSTGTFFTRCRIWLKFCIRIRIKPSNDRGMFELDRTKSKTNIAENSFAVGYETHNCSHTHV